MKTQVVGVGKRNAGFTSSGCAELNIVQLALVGEGNRLPVALAQNGVKQRVPIAFVVMAYGVNQFTQSIAVDVSLSSHAIT